MQLETFAEQETIVTNSTIETNININSSDGDRQGKSEKTIFAVNIKCEIGDANTLKNKSSVLLVDDDFLEGWESCVQVHAVQTKKPSF